MDIERLCSSARAWNMERGRRRDDPQKLRGIASEMYGFEFDPCGEYVRIEDYERLFKLHYES